MFQLHERLAADTTLVCTFDLCRVLLMNNRVWPWLILVPARAGVVEIHHLDAADRVRLIEEIARASAVLEDLFRPDKINVGALGNIVPQLHVHVIARGKGDPAWPGPVWGSGFAEPYGVDERDGLVDKLRRRLLTGSNP
ncbi:MAG TPA: HIT family protein [Azospirillum sp.]|nr:HIT family protein [Azospirillum sp.]